MKSCAVLIIAAVASVPAPVCATVHAPMSVSAAIVAAAIVAAAIVAAAIVAIFAVAIFAVAIVVIFAFVERLTMEEFEVASHFALDLAVRLMVIAALED